MKEDIPDDVTRCDGVRFEGFEWHERNCLNCLRRIALRPDIVWMMDAPKFIEGHCNERIGR